jgi:hypothetical protein
MSWSGSTPVPTPCCSRCSAAGTSASPLRRGAPRRRPDIDESILPLNYVLRAEQHLLRSTVRDSAKTRVMPVAGELDREGRFPHELVAELAAVGLMMGIPLRSCGSGGAGARGEGRTRFRAASLEQRGRAVTASARCSLGRLRPNSSSTSTRRSAVSTSPAGSPPRGRCGSRGVRQPSPRRLPQRRAPVRARPARN